MNINVPELGGFDTGLVLENLGLIFDRQEPWLEAAVAQLSELSDTILKDAAYDPDTLYSILLSLQGYAAEDAPAHHSSSAYVKNMEKCLGVYQRLLLYHFLFLKLGKIPPLTEHTPRELPPSAKGRIAYLKSNLANKAYIRFAKHIPSCREADFHSFVDACEEVAGGLCEYCILPLHTSADGQLMSFYRLIIKYRLQIVAVYDVEHPSGTKTETTTFGLLRSMEDTWDMLDLWENPFLDANVRAPLSLALLYISNTPHAFGNVLTAAECCSLPLREAGCLPYTEVSPLLFSAADNASATVANSVFYLSFDMGNFKSLSGEALPQHGNTPMPQAFLMHLMVESSDNLILGLYPKL